jgi:glycosyltransferase involved in cell wall biosynthesis
MNILLMISKNDKYGAQRIFLDQVACLKSRGHAVFVAVKGSQGFVTDSVRSLGLPCHASGMKGLKDILALRRLIKSERIDLIHTTLDRADYFGLLLSWITGRPIVSTMMVPRCHPGYRFMDRVIALADKQAAILKSRNVRPERIRVIRPGIDVARFSNPDPEKKADWQKKLRTADFSTVFCHISSLLERKAHLVSLEIVNECKKKGEQPLLVIIGDPLQGEYYETLLSRSAELGIRDNVYFTGWTTDVPEILALSHFTLLPSENEALGVVLMEGMAAGTPIIAREGEGGAELIGEYGTGFLYKPGGSVSELAARILSFRRTPKVFDSLVEKCRATANREFSLDRFGERLEQVYAETLRTVQ